MITKHFNDDEFKVSSDHPELAKAILITPFDRLKLFYLCRTILEPVREKYGSVTILSGKRSEELNKAAGGSPSSDHLFTGYSCAADFTLTSKDKVKQCFDLLKKEYKNCFGQLIYYPKQNFIHVSLPTEKHCGEVLTK